MRPMLNSLTASLILLMTSSQAGAATQALAWHETLWYILTRSEYFSLLLLGVLIAVTLWAAQTMRHGL